MAIEEVLKETAGELSHLINPKNILGEPIDLGDRVVLPVTRFGIGFGAGSGAGKDGEGNGAAGGGGIEPIALLIIHKELRGAEGVQVYSLKKDNPIAQVINSLSESLVPQVIEFLKKDGETETTEKKKDDSAP